MPVVKTLRSSVMKGLAQQSVTALEIGAAGVVRDRRFGIVDARGELMYTGQLQKLAGSSAWWDEAAEELTIQFGDGDRVTAAAHGSETMDVITPGPEPVACELLDDRLAAEISARLGKPVKVVRLPVSAANDGPVTLISTASLDRLQREMGLDSLDPRRFKMTIQLDGPAEYEEDTWEGREITIGGAGLRVGGQVPRCMMTTLDPDTLKRDADTLRVLLRYRERMATGAPPFGVYAEVVSPGLVRVGDAAVISGR